MKEISFVIPSVGGFHLYNTINCIYLSNISKFEVIVVVPKNQLNSVTENLKDFPVVLIPTEINGQVYQRMIGFKNATGNLVIQLDDDILFNENLISELVIISNSFGPGNAFAPLLRDVPTGIIGENLKFDGLISFFVNLEDFFLYGFPWGKKKQGKFSLLNRCYGVNPSLISEPIFKVDWLPGGFVLNFKEDLILYNFYPFEGKAFSEDLFHSKIRNANGIKHYVIPSIVADHDYEKKKKFRDKLSFYSKIQQLFHLFKHNFFISKALGASLFSNCFSVLYNLFKFFILFIVNFPFKIFDKIR